MTYARQAIEALLDLLVVAIFSLLRPCAHGLVRPFGMRLGIFPRLEDFADRCVCFSKGRV